MTKKNKKRSPENLTGKLTIFGGWRKRFEIFAKKWKFFG